MQLVRNIILDLNNNICTTIEAKQKDVKSRFIEFTLIDKGTPVNLTGNTVKIFAIKQDNTIIFNNVEIVNSTEGKIKAELTSQTLAVVGELRCELVIFGEDSSVLSSKVFSINVLKSIRDDGAIESQNEFTALTNGLANLAEYDNYKKDVAENKSKVDKLKIDVDAIPMQPYITEKAKTIDVNNKLVLKADKSQLVEITQDIQVLKPKVDSLASGSPKKVYETKEQLIAALPTGDTNIYVVTMDGKWYYWNGNAWVSGGVYQSTGIADKSITARQVVFFDMIGKNLFDKTKIIRDYCLNGITGELIATKESGYYSDYILIKNGETYTVSKGLYSGSKGHCFYDINKGFISGVVSSVNFDVPQSLTAPVNAAYIRISGAINKIDSQQVEKGSKATTHEEYKEVISQKNIEQIASKWQGKNANFLGDSITYGYTPGTGAQLNNPWPQQIVRKLGLSISRNYGISSTTIATKTSDINWDATRQPMVKRYLKMDNDADIIGCLAGINDFWLGVPLGTFDSRDTDNFYGALHTLYSGLINKYPTKFIFVMTCLQTDRVHPLGNTLKEWVTAQRQVAEYYSIPVLDMYKELGIVPHVKLQYDYLMPDGLHPNQLGVDIMARKIASFIENG